MPRKSKITAVPIDQPVEEAIEQEPVNDAQEMTEVINEIKTSAEVAAPIKEEEPVADEAVPAPEAESAPKPKAKRASRAKAKPSPDLHIEIPAPKVPPALLNPKPDVNLAMPSW